MKHVFLQPSMTKRFYVCGGWMVFNDLARFVGETRSAEIVTYRTRDKGYRYLDDLVQSDFDEAMVWVHWQAHYEELAERLAKVPRVVVYSQLADFRQAVPERWPIVCVSRYLSAEWSVKEPWRWIGNLPNVLHPEAVCVSQERDIDVLVTRRKSAAYIHEDLVPALKQKCRVTVVDGFIPQSEFIRLLQRSRTYLYWMHTFDWGAYEGLGLQPMEAIACGCIPVSNFYGGLSDYLSVPENCRKIGVHSLEYDLYSILHAVQRHDGGNADSDRIRSYYSRESFNTRFELIERDLQFYYDNVPNRPHERFRMQPKPVTWRPAWYIALYKRSGWCWKKLRGVRPY